MKLLIDNIKRTIIFKDNKAFYKNKKDVVDVTLFFKKSKVGISVLKKKYSHMLVSENKKIIYGGTVSGDTLQFNLSTADIEDTDADAEAISKSFRKLISLYLMSEIYTSDGILTRKIDKALEEEGAEGEGEVDAKKDTDEEKREKQRLLEEEGAEGEEEVDAKKDTEEKREKQRLLEEEEKEIGKWELVKLTLRDLIKFLIEKTYNLDVLIIDNIKTEDSTIDNIKTEDSTIESIISLKEKEKEIKDIVNFTFALYSSILKQARIKKTYEKNTFNELKTLFNPKKFFKKKNTFHSDNPKKQIAAKQLAFAKLQNSSDVIKSANIANLKRDLKAAEDAVKEAAEAKDSAAKDAAKSKAAVANTKENAKAKGIAAKAADAEAAKAKADAKADAEADEAYEAYKAAAKFANDTKIIYNVALKASEEANVVYADAEATVHKITEDISSILKNEFISDDNVTELNTHCYNLIKKAKEKYKNITTEEYIINIDELFSIKSDLLVTEEPSDLIKKIKYIQITAETAVKDEIIKLHNIISSHKKISSAIKSATFHTYITKDMLDNNILHKLIMKDTHTLVSKNPEFTSIFTKAYTDICKIMNLYNEVYSRTKEHENTPINFGLRDRNTNMTLKT